MKITARMNTDTLISAQDLGNILHELIFSMWTLTFSLSAGFTAGEQIMHDINFYW